MTDNIFESYLSIIEAADNGNKGKAAAEAKKKGYTYAGWGKWSKGNMIVAKTEKDKLIPIKPESIGKKGAAPVAKAPLKKVTNAPTVASNGMGAVPTTALQPKEKSIENKFKSSKTVIDDTSADIMTHRRDDLAHIHGSNPGGFYVGADGETRYVKFYRKPQQATNEHAANAIYNALGIGAPKSRIFKKGAKTGYASDMIPGKLADTHNVNVAGEFVKGMAADLLLVNYDAVGLENDNIFQSKDGGLYRIDNGGSLLFRAQGELKPVEHLKDVSSMLNGIFNEEINQSYANVIHKALDLDYTNKSPKAIQAMFVKKYGKQFITAVSDINKLQKNHSGWANYLKKTCPPMDDKTRTVVAKVLETRTKQLVEMAKNIQTHNEFIDYAHTKRGK